MIAIASRVDAHSEGKGVSSYDHGHGLSQVKCSPRGIANSLLPCCLGFNYSFHLGCQDIHSFGQPPKCPPLQPGMHRLTVLSLGHFYRILSSVQGPGQRADI